jgi:hypothetical protein
MAEIAFTHERLGGAAYRVVWTGLDAGDTGAPFTGYEDSERTVQVDPGTIGDSTVSVQGSLDDTNFVVLHDKAGSDLDFTTARIEQIEEGVCSIRPSVSGTTGTGITVTMTYRIRGNR